MSDNIKLSIEDMNLFTEIFMHCMTSICIFQKRDYRFYRTKWMWKIYTSEVSEPYE